MSLRKVTAPRSLDYTLQFSGLCIAVFASSFQLFDLPHLDSMRRRCTTFVTLQGEPRGLCVQLRHRLTRHDTTSAYVDV